MNKELMNGDLLESVETLSNHYLERFKQLRDNEQHEDADAIALEYICNDGAVLEDNYEWLYINHQFKEM